MTEKLQSVIEAARELSFPEQLELMSVLSQLMYGTYAHQPRPSLSSFWQPKSLEQHIREQQTRPVMNVQDLVADFWPEEESVDEFIEYTYGLRQVITATE